MTLLIIAIPPDDKQLFHLEKWMLETPVYCLANAQQNHFLKLNFHTVLRLLHCLLSFIDAWAMEWLSSYCDNPCLLYFVSIIKFQSNLQWKSVLLLLFPRKYRSDVTCPAYRRWIRNGQVNASNKIRFGCLVGQDVSCAQKSAEGKILFVSS